jgi:osmotically-inducible protein OsmY
MQRSPAILSYLASGLMVSGLVVSAAGEACAQQGATSGSFGARSMGSSFTPSASNFGGSAAARGGAGGMGGGGHGGLGSLGVGGAGGSVAGATTRGDATVGQVTGNERFVRNNRRAGQFVGGDTADTNNIFSQLQGMAAQQGPRNQNQQNVSSLNVRGPQTKARVQLTPGFSYAFPTEARVGTDLQQRLEKSKRIERRGPITVTVEGRTAVLSGLVATEHDRELAERVALLEAGVSAVRNELAVDSPSLNLPSPPAAQPPTLPAPTNLPQPTPQP